jgi:nucleotide-binding universal stress UspA family protein
VISIRKVLCPVDFSEASRAAMRYAVDLCLGVGASLTLCHVYQAPGYALPEGVVLSGPELLTELAQQVDRALDKWKREARELGMVDVRTESALGVTHFEIDRIAESGGYDLIVIGTHGRTGLRHVLLGSVAERVVRTAPCPVLTIRGAQASQSAEAPATHPG